MAPGVRRWRWRLMVIAAVSLLSTPAAGQDNAATPGNSSNATGPVVPYLNGRWKVNFRYSEMKGNVGGKSGCQGVWPYIYSIEYEVYQIEGSTQYVLCRVGDDCVGNTYTVKELQQSSFINFRDSCELQEHSVLDSGLDAFIMTQYQRGNGLPALWNSHTEVFEQEYGYARDHLFRPIVPSTWSRFKVPGAAEVNLKKMSAEEKEQQKLFAAQQPWGRFCDQYDWPDLEILGPGFASEYYAGTLRHENMTWVWIKDLSTCPCFPRCKQCAYQEPGTSSQFQKVNETCIAEYDSKIEECDYKIVGVGGGPVVYPPATTGREPDDSGVPLICYSYTLIDGFRTLPASKVPIPPGIKLRGAGVQLVHSNIALAFSLALGAMLSCS